ncbi:MAG: phage portal protein [Isosphaeraceae bacterium]
MGFGGEVRKWIGQLAGFATRSAAPEGRFYRLDWGQGASGNTPSGVAVTPQSALTVGAYFACVNRVSRDVGSHPFRVVRKVPGKGRVEVPGHPLNRVDWIPLPNNPSIDPDRIAGGGNRVGVMTAHVAHALTWQGGYLRIRTDASGEVEGLQLLDPAMTIGDWREDGTRYYRYGAKTFRDDEVLQLSGLSYNGCDGYPISRYSRDTIGLAKSQEIYGGRFFGSGGQPKGILKTNRKVVEEELRNLRATWTDRHGNGPGGSQQIAILEQDWTYQSISVPPEVAQFLESRKFQLVEICRWFGVPPHKVGDYSQMQLASAGVEAANLDYLMSTILSWIAAIEVEWNAKLLTDAERADGLCIEFDTNWLLRADLTTRAAYNREALTWGWSTRNEVREREGANPLPGCDEILVPNNQVPLSRLLAAPPTPTPATPGAPAQEPPKESPEPPDEDDDRAPRP